MSDDVKYAVWVEGEYGKRQFFLKSSVSSNGEYDDDPQDVVQLFAAANNINSGFVYCKYVNDKGVTIVKEYRVVSVIEKLVVSVIERFVSEV